MTSQFPNPLYPAGYTPPPQQPPRRSGPSKLWIILAAIGGGGLLLALVCCGLIASFFSTPTASAAARQPFSVAEVPVQIDEAKVETDPDYEPGVTQKIVSLAAGQEGGYYDTPGKGGLLYVWLPTGQHPPKSLPCVLITGAGSDLLSGMGLGEMDFKEQVPYAAAGFAVVGYELDGPSAGDGDPQAMREAFNAFKASRAGLVNARNAIEYALAKVPEVNPSKIFAAGHSSAATHALLFAEHEPRLAGVIAYAPAVDVPKWFSGRGGGLWLTSKLLPGSVNFLTQSSPSTHRQRLKCPTFLFHAEDDSTCDIAETKVFAEQLKQQGTDVTLVTVPSGEHYESMINEGIPAAIDWLQARK